MDIKVLGTGCSRCKILEKATIQAVKELELNVEVEKIEDIQKIMEYGILSMPGLVINGKIALTGQVPKIEELKTIIKRYKD
ncbi:thioredoxin family protein [Bacteroidota bacterium]